VLCANKASVGVGGEGEHSQQELGGGIGDSDYRNLEYRLTHFWFVILSALRRDDCEIKLNQWHEKSKSWESPRYSS
jgi:hypothetical protein